jgi:hypothetical protein
VPVVAWPALNPWLTRRSRFFEAAQGDLLVIDMGSGASLVYEVVTLSSRYIPPYNRIVIVNLRDDLDHQNPPYPLPSAPAQPPAGGAGSGTENGTPPSGDEPLTPEPAPDGGDSGTSSGGTKPKNVPSDPWAGCRAGQGKKTASRGGFPTMSGPQTLGGRPRRASAAGQGSRSHRAW